eukprot:jgi/Botrbrau1/19976/Bobra.0059s0091.1
MHLPSYGLYVGESARVKLLEFFERGCSCLGIHQNHGGAGCTSLSPVGTSGTATLVPQDAPHFSPIRPIQTPHPHTNADGIGQPLVKRTWHQSGSYTLTTQETQDVFA